MLSQTTVTAHQMNNTKTWRPITNVYSPPPNQYVYVLPLLAHEFSNPTFVSKIIGYRGNNFKTATRKCRVSYIWYNDHTKSIEVWGKKYNDIYAAVAYILNLIRTSQVFTN